MTSPITFSGLGSGIDTASIIQAMLESERVRHIEPYENWKGQWSDKISAFQSLQSLLVDLHTTAKALDSPAEFIVKQASSSDEDIIVATASSSALEGSYEIEVGANIKHRLASAGYTDSTITAFASQNDQIEITVGSNTEIITLGSDPTPSTFYTLEDVASEINTLSTLVTAQIINDGSSSNQYRLVLTAKTGGSSNRITIDTNDTLIDFYMVAAGAMIDDPEGSLNGTATISSGGLYTGTTNKSFFFTVTGSSTQNYTVGTDVVSVAWTESDGNSGTISIASAEEAVAVFQGLEIELSSGTIQGGDYFSIDVWHPDLQAPQDGGLAKQEREVHSGFVDDETTAVTLSNAIFSYTYNGQETQLDVSAGTTLSELADLINSDSQNPGVTASIMNDGAGLPNSYHLVLTSNTTGVAYKIESISHTLDQFSGNGDVGGGFTETQSAQNSMFRIDGYPNDDSFLQRSSNNISNLIAGVRLSLRDTGFATVTVSTDSSAIKQKIVDFVGVFNEMRSYIKAQTAYDAQTDQAGVLLGNYAVDTIKNKLNGVFNSIAKGFRYELDAYTTIMQIGITTDTELGSDTAGQLIIDESILDSALAENPEAVADLFSTYFEGRSVDSRLFYKGHITGITEPGSYEIFFDRINPSKSKMRISGGLWHTVASWDSSTSTLTGASGTPEAGLIVKIADTSSSFTGEIDLKLGFAGMLKEELDFLTSPASGPLSILEDNYQDIIDSIDSRIELEEKRISIYEQRLNERFARLEDLLTELNGQSSYISARLQQLSTTSGS